MYPTLNDLPLESRELLVQLLNARLADMTDLALQAKVAHWNVRGPSFIALHELFDDVVDIARKSSDMLAERAIMLGGYAHGTVQDVSRATSLSEYPEIRSGRDHVTALSKAIATTGKHVRAAIPKAEELGDADTADLFTEVSRDLDKYLWFVEAHAG